MRLVQDIVASHGGAERVFWTAVRSGMFSAVHVGAWASAERLPMGWSTGAVLGPWVSGGDSHSRFAELFEACRRPLPPPQGHDIIFTHHFGLLMPVDPEISYTYIHTPTRFLWETDRVVHEPRLFDDTDLDSFREREREIFQQMCGVAANSWFTRCRLRRLGARDVKVIYPPVSLWHALPPRVVGSSPRRYAVLVSRLVVHKNIGLAAEAANATGIPLVVVGTGRDERRLRTEYERGCVSFTGRVPEERLAMLVRDAAFLVCPTIEDFGLAPAEALTLGTPVVVPSVGAPVEYTDSATASYFDLDGAGVEALVAAMREAAERAPVSKETVDLYRDRFSVARFVRELAEFAGIGAVHELPAHG